MARSSVLFPTCFNNRGAHGRTPTNELGRVRCSFRNRENLFFQNKEMAHHQSAFRNHSYCSTQGTGRGCRKPRSHAARSLVQGHSKRSFRECWHSLWPDGARRMVPPRSSPHLLNKPCFGC